MRQSRFFSFVQNRVVRILGGAALMVGLGLALGWYARIHWVKVNGQRFSIRQNRESASDSKYKFINPLKESITAIIQDHIRQNNLQTASVYFDTRNGRWLGINSNEKYFPASLMKVPLMMAYLC